MSTIALKAALAATTVLSPAEMKVAYLRGQCLLSQQDCALLLGITVRTVQAHADHIHEKLCVSCNLELIRLCRQDLERIVSVEIQAEIDAELAAQGRLRLNGKETRLYASPDAFREPGQLGIRVYM